MPEQPGWLLPDPPRPSTQQESDTPPNASPLYRRAALQAARGGSIGGIVLTHPLSFGILAALAALIAGSLIAFLVWGTYTKRTTLRGELSPDPGLITVYAQQPGVVTAKHVAEGQPVTQGQVLFEVSAEGRTRRSVTALGSGTATAVAADVGEMVDGGRLLAAIVPAGAKLQAHLYVPGKAVGFIRPGDAVLLRYQAFPYQKFGHYRGAVAGISNTALSGGRMDGAAPEYRITVELDSQTVVAYGRPQPLQAGMLLEADVLQETRRLYEWALEPLFSVAGRP
jgi:multidrug efflux pump subunit AcrA (membrane-fusion protein)